MAMPTLKVVTRKNTGQRTMSANIDEIRVTLASGRVLVIYAALSDPSKVLCVTEDEGGNRINASIGLVGATGYFRVTL